MGQTGGNRDQSKRRDSKFGRVRQPQSISQPLLNRFDLTQDEVAQAYRQVVGNHASVALSPQSILTLQQSVGNQAVQRLISRQRAGFSGSHIRRKPQGGSRQSKQDKESKTGSWTNSMGEPNFRACVVLTYLGIPPDVIKVIVHHIMKAISDSYATASNRSVARAAIQRHKLVLMSLGLPKMLYTILRFALTGKIAFIRLPVKLIRPLRRLVLRLLLSVASRSALRAAVKILGPAALAIEAAALVACVQYCGTIESVKAAVKVISAIASGLDAATATLGSLSSKLTQQLLTIPLLTAQAKVDPKNWDLSTLPTRSRNNMAVIGFYIWHKLSSKNADQFLNRINKPLGGSPFNVPPKLFDEIAADATAVLKTRGGIPITIEGKSLRGLTPLQFVQFLKDYRLLGYKQEPSALARKRAAVQKSRSQPKPRAVPAGG